MTKSQNLRSLTLKSKIFNFDKIWQKIKIPPRWFIITLRFHQNSKVKIFPKFVPIWANKRYKIFSKFWSRYQNHQNLQNWLSSPKFWRKFLKPFPSLANVFLRVGKNNLRASKNPWRLREIIEIFDVSKALFSSPASSTKRKFRTRGTINYIFCQTNISVILVVDPSPKLSIGVGSVLSNFFTPRIVTQWSQSEFFKGPSFVL